MKRFGLIVLVLGLWFSRGAHAQCSQQQVIALQQRGATWQQINQICGVYQAPPQAASNRCFSQVGVCMLPGLGPIGATCWCATAYGPSPGVVR
jgi:hypothetical protein